MAGCDGNMAADVPDGATHPLLPDNIQDDDPRVKKAPPKHPVPALGVTHPMLLRQWPFTLYILSQSIHIQKAFQLTYIDFQVQQPLC